MVEALQPIHHCVAHIPPRIVNISNVVVAIPHFLPPSAHLNALLVIGDGLVKLPAVLVAIGQVEVISHIVRLVLNALGEQADVAFKFVSLGTAVPDIINEHRIFCQVNVVVAVGDINVFVCDTTITIVSVVAHNAHVLVVKGVVSLQYAKAVCLCQPFLLKVAHI